MYIVKVSKDASRRSLQDIGIKIIKIIIIKIAKISENVNFFGVFFRLINDFWKSEAKTYLGKVKIGFELVCGLYIF